MLCEFSCIVPLGFTTVAIALRSLWMYVSLVRVCEIRNCAGELTLMVSLLQFCAKRLYLLTTGSRLANQKTPPPLDWLQTG